RASRADRWRPRPALVRPAASRPRTRDREPLVPTGGGVGPPRAAHWSGAHALSALDRKSTRLNSSHVSISYAVFCLKKKSNRSNQAVLNTQLAQTHYLANVVLQACCAVDSPGMLSVAASLVCAGSAVERDGYSSLGS